MCGIFAYYNYHVPRSLQHILEVLIRGLKRLEYRGYDSAGICIDRVDACGHLDPVLLQKIAAIANGDATSNGTANGAKHGEEVVDGPHDLANGHAAAQLSERLVIKEVGKIVELERLVYSELHRLEVDLSREYQHHVGIAHTRWATHGQPSVRNGHPQVSDPSNEFVVVHNGIITNYKVIKEFLIKNGETFLSETDTEVVPKLCKFVYQSLADKPAFPKLVIEVLSQLEGASAFLFTSPHYPGELVAFKRGSPLILGVKEAPGAGVRKLASFSRIGDADDRRWHTEAMECWIASDASAVIEHTNRVIMLEDNDVLHVVGGGYGIYNTRMSDVEEAVPRVLQTLQMQVDDIRKGKFQHFMQKEIHEQPESLQATTTGRVQFQRPAAGNPWHTPRIKLGGLVDQMVAIRRCRRIMFVACGTSYYSCLAARQTVEEMCDTPVVLELASDLLDRRCPIFRDDTCVFVSQSGETADTLRALEYAKAHGALCMGVTNTVGSAISRGTHCGVHQNAGYEVGVASTKAYTSQIVCITMMALALAEDSISKRERRDVIIDELGQLPGKIRNTLQLDLPMKELAKQLKDTQSLLFFARGYNYATALEAALKMKEVCLIHSEGILAGEMKHGPLALVDEHLPIVVIATRDSMYSKMESVIQQLLARNARLIILCNEGDLTMRQYASQGCFLIEVPETVESLQPVINIVPLQLLSYHLTVLRGLNVDQPRNLAKSVTVSEEH